MYLCEHYGKHLNDVLFYSKKGKPITIEIACIRNMMKLINRKMSDYYHRASLDTLTPVSELPYEIKEKIIRDYTVHDTIVASLNLSENMRIALECRQNGLIYPEIGRVLSARKRRLRILHQNATTILGDLRISYKSKRVAVFNYN